MLACVAASSDSTTTFWATLIGAGATVATLVIVVYQTIIFRRQTAIFKGQKDIGDRQLTIMEIDAKIVQDQVAKKAELSVRVQAQCYPAISSPGHQWYGVPVYIFNDGTKGVRDCRLTICIPPGVPHASELTVCSSGKPSFGSLQMDENLWTTITAVVGPVYASDKFFAFNVGVGDTVPGRYSFAWRIASEEGRFPDGKFGLADFDLLPR